MTNIEGVYIMERRLETIFDLVTDSYVPMDKDTPHVVAQSNANEITVAEGQQILTMRRIASWLHSNAKIFQLEWDTVLGKELSSLADDLTHLANTKEELNAHK
mgnify:CR=1 FL=1